MEYIRSRNWKCSFWESVLPLENNVFKLHSPEDKILFLSFQLGLSPEYEHNRVPVSNYYFDTESKSHFSIHCPIDDDERANLISILKIVTIF